MAGSDVVLSTLSIATTTRTSPLTEPEKQHGTDFKRENLFTQKDTKNNKVE